MEPQGFSGPATCTSDSLGHGGPVCAAAQPTRQAASEAVTAPTEMVLTARADRPRQSSSDGLVGGTTGDSTSSPPLAALVVDAMVAHPEESDGGPGLGEAATPTMPPLESSSRPTVGLWEVSTLRL